MATIMITGATDGLGRALAEHLAGAGHRLVLHGRSAAKLDATVQAVAAMDGDAVVAAELADLSDLGEVEALAAATATVGVDVLMNNAGVYRTPNPVTEDGLDVRFVVNTVAPWVLTQRLLPSVGSGGRIVNLSSAAQAPVDLAALAGNRRLEDMEAYAQSKLAITMWSRHLADALGPDGPVVVAVNPGSLLATKMVKEGFGVAGSDIGIGTDVLTRAAIGDDFADATGRYYDTTPVGSPTPIPTRWIPRRTRQSWTPSRRSSPGSTAERGAVQFERRSRRPASSTYFHSSWKSAFIHEPRPG